MRSLPGIRLHFGNAQVVQGLFHERVACDIRIPDFVAVHPFLNARPDNGINADAGFFGVFFSHRGIRNCL